MRAVSLFVSLAALFSICVSASAAPTVNIFTNAASFGPGDAIERSLSAANEDEAMSVDVYVGIVMTDGDIWTTQSDGWSRSIEPWITSIHVPSGFQMERSVFWTIDLPRDPPPIRVSGDYFFAVVLMYPGTPEWISNANLAPFSYTASGPSPGITMLSVPGGSFLMGSPEDEPDREACEGPRRTVAISAFELSETEITQAQWEAVMGWNHCWFSGETFPVESLTWFDCANFCNTLSEIAGLEKCYTITNEVYNDGQIASADVSWDLNANGYRLPTEGEWEFACRAGTTTRFNTGGSDEDLGIAGWFEGNSGMTIHNVGEKGPNAWGFYDMHGNA
ncbi:MAG: formylglycine-generating enzyme family protein [Candidatus Coatesbacteria bacterium]|nr:formylglycine-generating enzyme family protein [Candidatus Coatesbacteria bacterium]